MSTCWVDPLLATLLREPGRPRLTWYGPQGERVELSGAVLVNWVTKTTNLLVDELDAGPGTLVRLDLPDHWRAVLWALAVWRTGAGVVVADSDVAADLLVADHAGPQVQVAVALPALARSFGAPLAAGTLDAAAVLAGFPDAPLPGPPYRAQAPALAAGHAAGHGAAALDHAALAALVAAPTAPSRTRALRVAGTRLRADALLRTLDLLAADGSAVLIGPGHPAGSDADLRDRLARTERAVAPDRTAGRADGPTAG